MIKVEVVTDKEPKNLLIVDGVIIENEMGYISGIEFKHLHGSVYDWSLSQKAMTATFNQIPIKIRSLQLSYNIENNEFVNNVEIVRDRYNSDNMELRFIFSWDFEKWKRSYSIEEFAEAMEYATLQNNNQNVQWVQEDEIISNGCHISCREFLKDETIESVIQQYIPVIEKIYQDANISLIEKSKKDSMVSLFEFPEQISVACEQYLLYFAEFLKDMGIKATTDISHGAGQVIFSVAPDSSEIALTQIREALNIYLHLPMNLSNLNYVNMTMSPREQQLLANIQHLNGQLSLANALVQAQQGIINNHQVTIIQQQKLIDASILQQSMLKDSNAEEDQEELLGGSFLLTNYKGNGYEINLPGIYRLIKEKIFK